MINTKEYFKTDYWINYEWYSFGNLRHQFYHDVFGFETFDISFKNKMKSMWRKFKKSPKNFIKNFIYYLPASWCMIKAFFVIKYKTIILKEPFYTYWI